MTPFEKIEEINNDIEKALDNFEKGETSMNDTLYILVERHQILSNMIKNKEYDRLQAAPNTLYALDRVLAEILTMEADEIDKALDNRLSLNNLDWSWKKEE